MFFPGVSQPRIASFHIYLHRVFLSRRSVTAYNNSSRTSTNITAEPTVRSCWCQLSPSVLDSMEDTPTPPVSSERGSESDSSPPVGKRKSLTTSTVLEEDPSDGNENSDEYLTEFEDEDDYPLLKRKAAEAAKQKTKTEAVNKKRAAAEASVDRSDEDNGDDKPNKKRKGAAGKATKASTPKATARKAAASKTASVPRTTPLSTALTKAEAEYILDRLIDNFTDWPGLAKEAAEAAAVDKHRRGNRVKAHWTGFVKTALLALYKE
ncbi:hypothetical protein FN846DRAFT_217530 [Sphaerosporella brunnea]|uniref:Uncharacterized protein n=1 Tax=Sphaerosporella brunnea TaxID=1250544 RepID=A0A5J5F819_9PEZI|nr:hypothetical protein FN846DRAFT_217530 [Sphaerosporella brunnea]